MGLISINGKSGSGKDTVGKIIQYLDCHTPSVTNIEHMKKFILDNKYQDSLNRTSNWQIKKYADKLKDMVCLLIGCTREQLEDQDFKSTPLGEEWQGYRVSWHCPGNEFEDMIFSTEEDAVKWLNQEGAETDIEQAYKDKCLFEIKLTPRDILQSLGTQWGRDMIHPNLWINSLFADYHSGIKMSDYTESKWIITDSRFPNDVEHVKKLGGITIRVNRPECEGRTNEHESETSLDNYQRFNYIIDNNGTIEELIKKVRVILIKENIIK